MTEKFFLLAFFNKIFSILSPVVTGTVDLVTIILKLFINLPISLATLKTWDKSAALLFFFVGVPTQIKMTWEFLIASDKFVVKLNLPDL